MTARVVVDTNVLVAANGRNTHVGLACQRKCVTELRRLCEDEMVCIDDRWLIMGEYDKYAADGGQPMPGTAFFKHVCQNLGNASRVRVVPVAPRGREGRDFADPELPPNNLKKDAKFLAVAVKAGAAIVNAADSDWVEHREMTDRLGVEVRQLCPQHATRGQQRGQSRP